MELNNQIENILRIIEIFLSHWLALHFISMVNMCGKISLLTD